MEASQSHSLTRPRVTEFREHPFRIDLAHVLRWVAACLGAALLISGLGLFIRRLTGSLTAPLSDSALVGLGVLAILWSAAVRLLWRNAADGSYPIWQHRAAEWGPTAALVLIATSAIQPGNSLAAAILIWAMIVAEELGAAWLVRRPRTENQTVPFVPVARRQKTQSQPLSQSTNDLPADVWQNSTRTRTADGRETIHGTLRTSFIAGQRIAIEHLVFCPLLNAVPQVSATALDELDCTVRATHTYRYGARLEIKLREPCDQATALLIRYDVVVPDPPLSENPGMRKLLQKPGGG